MPPHQHHIYTSLCWAMDHLKVPYSERMAVSHHKAWYIIWAGQPWGMFFARIKRRCGSLPTQTEYQTVNPCARPFWYCYSSARQIFNQWSYHQSSGYRVVLLLGKMRPQYSYPHTKVGQLSYIWKLRWNQNIWSQFWFQKSSTPIMGFIGLAIALPPPSVHEVSISKSRWLNSKSSKFMQWGCYSNQNCEEVILSKTESVCSWDQNYLIKNKQISLTWRSAITWHLHNTGTVGDWHVCHKTLLWLQNCPLWTKVSIVILVKFCQNENFVTIEILSQLKFCSGFATCWTTLPTTWLESQCILLSTQPMFIKSNRLTSTVSNDDDINFGFMNLTLRTMLMMSTEKVPVLMRIVAVIKKGQVMSNYYRLMNRQGGFWHQE